MGRAFSLIEASKALGFEVCQMQAAIERYGKGGNVVIRESDPSSFLTKLLASIECGCTPWLASPEWGDTRIREMTDIMNEARSAPCSIMIPTGGTTGRLRFAVHTWETLAASADGFGEFFGESDGHKTLCVLPTYHVSGLMQAVRVLTLGGQFVTGNAHDPRVNLPDGFLPHGFFISLVPTQLRRLLDDGAAEWLRQFKTILIGGAALDANLATRALTERLPLSPSYGMTETAAVACALRPEAFLAGAKGVGRPLPHVNISLEANSRVRIRSKSLCKAMIPSVGISLSNGLLTNDIGEFDAEGVLHIRGRTDRVIVSGGQKIDPVEVEAALLATELVRDAYVLGIPNADWGEAVVALYVAANDRSNVENELRAGLRKTLSPVHVPKKWIPLDAIPRSEAGKPDMAAIRALATA